MDIAKPKWWPDNPYPVSVFPMPREEYSKIVPDPHIRTALSGMLGREFWDIASRSIFAAYQNETEDLQFVITELQTELERTKNYGEFDSSPCPLCEFKEGKIVKLCSMHSQIQWLQAENKKLRGEVEELKKLLEEGVAYTRLDGITPLLGKDFAKRAEKTLKL